MRVLCVLLVLSCLGAGLQPPGPTTESVPTATLPPLATVDGGTWIPDGPVLLDLMDVYCGPCARQMPVLDALHEAGLPITSIDVAVRVADQEAGLDRLREFRDEHGAAWTFAVDPAGAWMVHFGADVVPTLILIDGDGQELGRWVGTSVTAQDILSVL